MIIIMLSLYYHYYHIIPMIGRQNAPAAAGGTPLKGQVDSAGPPGALRPQGLRLT